MKTIILFSFFLLLSACVSKPSTQSKDKESKTDATLFIDVERSDKVSVFDFFSEIEIIPLETTTESLVNEPVMKVILHNENYYLYDQKQQAILVFDKKGKFLHRINKRGEGPGEYAALDDFNFNRFTGNLELMDAWGSILVYDPIEYKYIETIPINKVMHYFANLTDDIYVCFSNTRKPYKMFFYSKKEQKIIAEAYEFPTYIMTHTYLHSTYSPFYEYKDSLFFAQAYNGQIFNVNISPSISLTDRYKWDFGKHNLDLKTIPEGKDHLFYINYLRKANYNHPFQFIIYAENNTYFMTRFKYKHRHKVLVYNKNHNSYLLFENFTEGFQPFPMFMDDEAVYAYIHPEYLSYSVNASVLDEKNKQRLKQIKEDDNPVIIRYIIKSR